jgi:hypothetical protein
MSDNSAMRHIAHDNPRRRYLDEAYHKWLVANAYAIEARLKHHEAKEALKRAEIAEREAWALREHVNRDEQKAFEELNSRRGFKDSNEAETAT